MVKRIVLLIFGLSLTIQAYPQYDLIIVGGTPGGIMAAIAAARTGKTSVILERTNHIGGLPANGLGATDIATRGATTGLFAEFTERIKQHYIRKYGAGSQQVIDCSDGYHFEPSVGETIVEEMLSEEKGKITVLKMRQFDVDPKNILIINDCIEKIVVLNRYTKMKEEYVGKIFIDATYEGDLGAAANVPFRLGRESKDEYNEPGAGRIYKYWGGPMSDGSTLQGDNAVQAYNFRLCLTNNRGNRMDVAKPLHYRREEYKSLVEDSWAGRHTGVEMMPISMAMHEENRQHIAKGNRSKIPGDPWGIAKITNMVKLPNEKTDANNQHLSFLSTDLPEENWPWPTSGWAWRDEFTQRLRDYTLGLIWFSQNDKDLPKHFREAAKEWGLAKDEYIDNKNFPRQVYVREGRRLEGMYIFTANDAISSKVSDRPVVHTTSITASHYALDSHAVRKREDGRVHLDGFFSYPTSVYTVPFGVMVPKVVNNLLFSVPVSATHVGYSTLRMEPCWMALGQAAGVAASMAIDNRGSIRNMAIEKLQDVLISQKCTLIYYRDVNPEDQDFKLVQTLGLKGYLPEWDAKLDEAVNRETIKRWENMSGINLRDSGKEIRRDLLKIIFQSRLSDGRGNPINIKTQVK